MGSKWLYQRLQNPRGINLAVLAKVKADLYLLLLQNG